METKVTNIKERILLIAENKGISKEIFFKDLGVSYGSFKGKSKEKSLSSDVLATIVTKYSDINPIWILTGEGKMLVENVKNEENTVKGEKPYEIGVNNGSRAEDSGNAVENYRNGVLEKELAALMSRQIKQELQPLLNKLDHLKKDITNVLQIAEAQQVFNEAVLKGINTEGVK